VGVTVVEPGEKVMLGRSNTMWLTGQGMFLVTPETSGNNQEAADEGGRGAQR
jgi:hypothetical protein